MTGGQMHRFDRLDHYEAALAELLAKKQKGQPIAAAKKAAPSNVVNLIDALRASLKFGKRSRRPDPKNPSEESHQEAQGRMMRLRTQT
jgi:non-homologous end joining protein Ku